ncbi:hypothetical protein BVRB_2g031020 [Beta vulgaris subsp. vulgaris]|nr:hypothetical protein BVRB_2g031020 [Beta vulgaris subsp. vulgaris]
MNIKHLAESLQWCRIMKVSKQEVSTDKGIRAWRCEGHHHSASLFCDHKFEFVRR